MSEFMNMIFRFYHYDALHPPGLSGHVSNDTSKSDDLKKARRPEAIAVELLRHVLTLEVNSCPLGDVTALEIAILCASMIDTCPLCGATAWVDNDCDLCELCTTLKNRGE